MFVEDEGNSEGYVLANEAKPEETGDKHEQLIKDEKRFESISTSTLESTQIFEFRINENMPFYQCTVITLMLSRDFQNFNQRIF